MVKYESTLLILVSVLLYSKKINMSKQYLEKNEEEIYQQIEKEFKKSKKDIEDNIKIIREWFKTQPHLPEIPGK